MTETKRTIWERLAEPFAPHELETKDRGGKELTYVKAWAIQDRLDAVVGPENWTVEITVTTADPRPVYTCTLRVKNPSNGIWAIRCATSGEPHMPGGPKGTPDFENGGKGGGTQAFKKAFQDGFCRYLMRGDQPDAVPFDWGAKAQPAKEWQHPEDYEEQERKAIQEESKPLSKALETDEDWNPPADYPADMSPEEQAAELEKLRGPKPTDYSPLLKRGLSMDQFNPDSPPCPVCGGKTWDNREPSRGGKGKFQKKTPRAPDFKCRDKRCDGVLWPAS